MNEEKILHDEALDEDSDWAFWFDGKNINEIMFCQYFLQLHPMKCVRGRLFTVDGIVEDEGEISQMILEEVRGCLTSGVAKTVSNLLASLKLMAYSPPLPIETDRIHVANGTYFLNGTFTEDKFYCNNSLKWHITQTHRSRNDGCIFCPICSYRRTFLPCRNISAIV